MRKRAEVEIAAELAIDAVQQVEIETRGDAGAVIVGVNEHALVLFEIDADDHPCALSQNIAGAAQESAGFMRLEISQRRPREKTDFRHCAYGVGQRERRGEICRDRIDVESRKILSQGICLRFQKIAGNIDGDVGAKGTLVE